MPTTEQRSQILKACQLCGGTHTAFNQSWKAIKDQRLLDGFYNDKSESWHDKVYIGGMCHSMSLYWLALRSRGRSFMEWLKPNGAWSKGAINVLVVKTGMYKNTKNKFVSDQVHEDFDAQFFAHYGLRPYGAPLNGLGNILRYIDLRTAGYHVISLGGAISGHAVAARIVDGGEGAFFDPNYGEYVFPSNVMLGSFMKAFVKFSGYDAKYTDRQSIETFR